MDVIGDRKTVIAAAAGHLECLKYVCDNGLIESSQGCLDFAKPYPECYNYILDRYKSMN